VRFLNRPGGLDDIPTMSARGIRSRALAVGLALVCVFAGMATSRASLTDRLDQARADLQALSDQVAEQSVAVQDARDQAAEAADRATEASQALIPLTVRRVQISQRLDAVNAELAAAQDDFDQAVVDTFVGSPGTVPGMDTFAAVLGAQSLDQMQDQIAFGDAVTREREAALRLVTSLQRRLNERGTALDGLIAAAQELRSRRDEALAEQQAAVVREQQALQTLDGTRAEIVALIERLRDRLAPQDISEVATAFQGEHHISYGDWANAFLRVVGAPRCHENLVVTVAWQVQEGTQAAWNPLATTHRMTGSTDFNDVGVQNYRSLEQGLRATQETIENGWDQYGYGAIIRSMHDCADALDTAGAIAASTWCAGCADGQYVVGLVPAVEASFDTYAEL
jgi:hypothetical protein